MFQYFNNLLLVQSLMFIMVKFQLIYSNKMNYAFIEFKN